MHNIETKRCDFCKGWYQTKKDSVHTIKTNVNRFCSLSVLLVYCLFYYVTRLIFHGLSVSVFQLCGESATTPSITAACLFGWSRTIAVPSASRTGWFRESANELHLQAVWFSDHTCMHLKVVTDLTMIVTEPLSTTPTPPTYDCMFQYSECWRRMMAKINPCRILGHWLVDLTWKDEESWRDGRKLMQCMVICELYIIICGGVWHILNMWLLFKNKKKCV